MNSDSKTSDSRRTPTNPKSKTKDQVFSVSEINRKVKTILETSFSLLWIEGEISNLSQPASGHWYFVIKDQNAQIRCAMFRSRNNLVRYKPQNGDQVRMRARVSLYEGRGDYQLIVEHMEDAGYGLLQRRYEELKEKLQSEGLFDTGFKKPLPLYPKRIGVITSSTGAALRDVIHVLKRRTPSTAITVYPALVQGEKAPEDLIKAIELANVQKKAKACDVLILCRGGGSIEDLWGFNSEQLARVIFSSDIPIVSAVGHEIDFTISDFVADTRASTPSAAAELVSPDVNDQLNQISTLKNKLERAFIQQYQKKNYQFEMAQARLRHPGDIIEQWYQRLDQIHYRLAHTIHTTLEQKKQHLLSTTTQLKFVSPSKAIIHHKNLVQHLKVNLFKNMKTSMELKRLAFANIASTLDAVSPLATLNRGYAIVKDAPSNKVIKITSDTSTKQDLKIQFSDGEIDVRVK